MHCELQSRINKWSVTIAFHQDSSNIVITAFITPLLHNVAFDVLSMTNNPKKSFFLHVEYFKSLMLLIANNFLLSMTYNPKISSSILDRASYSCGKVFPWDEWSCWCWFIINFKCQLNKCQLKWVTLYFINIGNKKFVSPQYIDSLSCSGL